MDIKVIGSLVVEVNEFCTLNCDMCLRGNQTNKKITKEVVEKIFNNIKYIDEIVFTGGEITLAYNEIKMIIEYIKKHNIKVKSYQIVVNGTYYNKELFDLLHDNFENGHIYLSIDYFHDKSILEKYKDKLDFIYDNYEKIMMEPDYAGIYQLPYIIIDSGKACNLTNICKEKPPILPFVSKISNNTLYVGPEINFDVSGNFTIGSSTYEKNKDNCYGNIFEIDLEKLILKKSLKRFFVSNKKFMDTIKKLEQDFFTVPDQKQYYLKNGKIIRKKRIITNNKFDKTIYDDSKRLIYQMRKRDDYYENNNTKSFKI